MSTGHENIFPTVVVKIDHTQAEAGTQQACFPHAVSVGHLQKFLSMLIFEKRKCLVRQGRKGDVGIPVVVVIAKIGTHARNEVSIFGESDSRLHRDLVELATRVVEQKIVIAVVGDEYVRLAIQVVVGHGGPHTFADLRSDSPLSGNIAECTVALVQEELIGQSLVKSWRTVIGDFVIAADRFGGKVPFKIVDDK
jgi:hypothetical protein